VGVVDLEELETVEKGHWTDRGGDCMADIPRLAGMFRMGAMEQRLE